MQGAFTKYVTQNIEILRALHFPHRNPTYNEDKKDNMTRNHGL